MQKLTKIPFFSKPAGIQGTACQVGQVCAPLNHRQLSGYLAQQGATVGDVGVCTDKPTVGADIMLPPSREVPPALCVLYYLVILS